MKFVKDNTPENANIVIPPQAKPWLSSGNLLLDRYILFPRNLIQNGVLLTNLDTLPEDTYIMVYKGEWCNGGDCEVWPKQTIKAEELILKDPDSSNVSKVLEDVMYNPDDRVYTFGLLKI